MVDESLPWDLVQCRAGCWRAADLPGGLCYHHSGYPARPSARITVADFYDGIATTMAAVEAEMPRVAPEPPPVPDDRPTLAPCTRCGVRPTFYGVCDACTQRSVMLRDQTPFQTARPRDSLFFAEEGE